MGPRWKKGFCANFLRFPLKVDGFEKMLYDNAQLAYVYLDAQCVTDESLYCTIAQETLDYVVR